MGEMGILNVGAGDTKLTFDPANPVETIRAGRIVRDMLRRGYALIIAVPGSDPVRYERVRGFREDTAEYIIADFDPEQAAADPQEDHAESDEEEAAPTPAAAEPAASEQSRPRPRRGTRAVKASATTGVAVAPSAGG